MRCRLFATSFSKLEPAAIKIAVVEAKCAIAYNYYVPDLYDMRCGVIQAVATSGASRGKPIATLLNYASHPEALDSDKGIVSSDFCGPFYTRTE
jgi:hypothetical protein